MANNFISCKSCGHRAAYHTGVGEKGYMHPKLSCRFETDRYEICTCNKLKIEPKDLETLVAWDETKLRYS